MSESMVRIRPVICIFATHGPRIMHSFSQHHDMYGWVSMHSAFACAGVVHRDIKPENFMYGRGNKAYLWYCCFTDVSCEKLLNLLPTLGFNDWVYACRGLWRVRQFNVSDWSDTPPAPYRLWAQWHILGQAGFRCVLKFACSFMWRDCTISLQYS